jgi:2-polyprenyl-6-methoxyphenol hydroxylase-like FAD-dependent oxidoreductase
MLTKAVIGCDGIHSKMRELMLGADHPACNPSYSHKYAIRGLVPMDEARAALGVFKTSNRVMHCGPGAHALTFPVANNKILNVVAFVTDPEEWVAPDKRFVVPATKAEATAAFSEFSPVVQNLMDLLPENLEKWAVFDTHKQPVPSYINGRLCLAGDAAHASSPHHGAGAGCGIEDCLALAVLLQSVSAYPKNRLSTAVRVALQVYNNVRYDRSQWIMDTSRVIGEVYEFQNPECLSNHEKIAREIHDRSHKIWDYDIDVMADDSLGQFRRKIEDIPSPAASKTDLELDTQLVTDSAVSPYLDGFPL